MGVNDSNEGVMRRLAIRLSAGTGVVTNVAWVCHECCMAPLLFLLRFILMHMGAVYRSVHLVLQS
jgi:hypothetical protein